MDVGGSYGVQKDWNTVKNAFQTSYKVKKS